MTHGSENPQNAPPAAGSGASGRKAIDRRRLAIDAAVGAGLLVALAIVFALGRAPLSPDGKNSSTAPSRVEVVVDEVDETAGAPAGSRRSLRLGVTPPEYDDMAKLLDALGS